MRYFTLSSFYFLAWALSAVASLNPSISELRTRADRLLKLRSEATTERVISSGADQQDLIYVYGVPTTVQEVKHEGKMIFRHYSPNFLPKILASQSLKAGPRPFIDPYPHARYEYQDLTGPMMTTPEFPASELWLEYSEKTNWVDFTIDASVPVLLCKAGNLLIPTQKNYPEWIRAEYQKYRETGLVSMPSLELEFKRLDQENGLKPQAEIPIHIIRYQLDGVVHSFVK
jgi:hypothetical protein